MEARGNIWNIFLFKMKGKTEKCIEYTEYNV